MPDGSHVDLLVAEVHALRATVAGLAARLARVEARQATRLSPTDADRLVAFLVAVVAAVGSRAWNLPDLAALALIPGNAMLADALATIVGTSTTLRSAGRFLRRCTGVTVDGLVLDRVGDGRDGAVYVVRVSAGL